MGFSKNPLYQQITPNELRKLEDDLDAAIFDLYELTAAERDLIRERCSIGLDLFYQHQKGDALREVIQPTRNFGTLSDLSQTEADLAAYLRTFIEAWNVELAPDGELAWRVLSPPSGAPLLAVCFTTRYKQEKLPSDLAGNNIEAWSAVLNRYPAGFPRSRRIEAYLSSTRSSAT